MASGIMIGVFLVLMLLGVPVGAAMGLSAILGLDLLDLPLAAFARYLTQDVRSVPLLAVPFFILTGNLMNRLEMTRRIFDFINGALGFLRGGLAHVNVAACMVFGGISGSALADLAGVGTMVIQAMTRAGYRAEFSAALTVSSSLLAPILPPSIMFIIYSVLMNVSVAKMFAAGILPGVVFAIILVINNMLLQRLNIERYPPPVRTPPREVLAAGLRALPGLATPVVILRSMISGWVTPSEASTVAVCYTLGLGFLYREVTLERLRLALLDTARMTALVMYLTGIGTVMGFVLTSDQVAVQLAHGISFLTQDKWVVLSLATLSLLVLGCFLETVPALLIGVPLFGPLVASFGIDPLHFGVVLTFALLLGIIHPPVGLGLFTVCAITGLRLEAVVRATFLFYPALMLALLVFMFVPILSTWLPRVLFSP
jgi:tripartite ATP-independent transporter DctM subunit